jgi:hypothetical protein
MSNTIVQPTEQKAVKPNFGSGRYSPLMEECYNDAMAVFKLNSAKAESLARDIASDLGNIFASATVKVKVGSVNKDGKLTLSEASKVKGMTCTLPISALKALDFANQAGKNGFVRNNTQWQVGETLASFFETL